MELTGPWRAEIADDERRREFHRRDHDDADWHDVEVPGHWADHEALADARNVLYRHHFRHEPPGEGERLWLELDGIFSQGDVWLDGNYLGDTEGYFIRHAFDVADALDAGVDHVLAVEVSCSPAGPGTTRRQIMGIFEGGTGLLPDSRPGGIWAPIRMRRTGPVRLDRLRAICTAADEQRATVSLRALLTTTSARTVTVTTTIAGVEHELERGLAEGDNQVEWSIDIPEPDLWWPRSLGDQPMHDLTVTVATRHDEISDIAVRRIGLRRAQMRNWKLSVNGERLFCKGANLPPLRPLLGHATDDDAAAMVALAVDAGLDLVRPYAHVSTDAFYRYADEAGLLVWQDLPLEGHAANSVRRQAVRSAAAMVERLGHHPSIVTWNAHVAPAVEWMQAGPRSARHRAAVLASHQLPTWTKSVLDRSIKRTIDHHDGSRHTSGFTGVLPHAPRLDGTATHLWFGWRRGAERDLAGFASRWPSQVRFVAEFGAQSMPADPVVEAPGWPHVDRQALAAAGAEMAAFDRYVPPDGHDEYADWCEAGRLYQAGLVRRQVETLRRLKYRPVGGFCVHALVDTAPVIGFGLVDHLGRAKPGMRALAEACRPVIVVADRLPATVRPGDPIALDVHVVNDGRTPLPGAVVDVELSWPGGGHRWRFTGEVGADDVTRVGIISWVVPDAPGLATLTLTLSGPVEATNRYDTTIRRAP